MKFYQGNTVQYTNEQGSKQIGKVIKIDKEQNLDDSVLVEFTDSGARAWLASHALAKFHTSRYVNLIEQENGMLVELTDYSKAYYEGYSVDELEKKNAVAEIYELLEDFTANGWDWVRPEAFGAMTDNPYIIGQDVEFDEERERVVEFHGELYHYADYWHYNALTTLVKDGSLFFERVPDNDVSQVEIGYIFCVSVEKTLGVLARERMEDDLYRSGFVIDGADSGIDTSSLKQDFLWVKSPNAVTADYIKNILFLYNADAILASEQSSDAYTWVSPIDAAIAYHRKLSTAALEDLSAALTEAYIEHPNAWNNYWSDKKTAIMTVLAERKDAEAS